MQYTAITNVPCTHREAPSVAETKSRTQQTTQTRDQRLQWMEEQTSMVASQWSLAAAAADDDEKKEGEEEVGTWLQQLLRCSMVDIQYLASVLTHPVSDMNVCIY